MRYLVTYDICDDDRREKVIKLLNDCGKRVQFSCFEIDISSQELESLLSRLSKIIDKDEDKIYIFPLSKFAVPFVKKLGKRDTEGNSSLIL